MSRGKVLIADDEEDILEIVADRLEFLGFEVQTVQDGLACIETIERGAPDLVLLDIRMPRMDGMEVLTQLRETHPELPVVILSASSERKVAEETLSEGAVDYLLKPFEARDLEKKLDRVFGKGGQ